MKPTYLRCFENFRFVQSALFLYETLFVGQLPLLDVSSRFLVLNFQGKVFPMIKCSWSGNETVLYRNG